MGSSVCSGIKNGELLGYSTGFTTLFGVNAV